MPGVGPVAAVNGETSMGFAFAFHVSSSSSESDKSERSSVATEETEISDSESLWFLASNLACFPLSNSLSNFFHKSQKGALFSFAFVSHCHHISVAIFMVTLSETLSCSPLEMTAKTLFYWLKHKRTA